jgi:hypothetical protein
MLHLAARVTAAAERPGPVRLDVERLASEQAVERIQPAAGGAIEGPTLGFAPRQEVAVLEYEIEEVLHVETLFVRTARRDPFPSASENCLNSQ